MILSMTGYANASAELDRVGANLETQDPKKRVAAFRRLGSLEKNFLSGMHDAVMKLANSSSGLSLKNPKASNENGIAVQIQIVKIYRGISAWQYLDSA